MTISFRCAGSAGALLTVLVVGAMTWSASSRGGELRADVTIAGGRRNAQDADATSASDPGRAQLLRGRALLLHHGCADCHGGGPNPAAQGWLAGVTSPQQEFRIGPCSTKPDAAPEAKACFVTRPRNLTPDNTTGMGRFSERQIFNALRFGLRPGETADVAISSSKPGEGNYPANPKYLAPPMPWPAFRHMRDQELRDIVAYLKHGVKPVRNRVEDSEGPPDFWASEYTVAKIGPHPAAPFPTANEVAPKLGSRR